MGLVSNKIRSISIRYFLLYYLVCVVMSLWSFYLPETSVAFGYDAIISSSELAFGVLTFTLCFVSVLLGISISLSFKSRSTLIRGRKLRLSANVRLLILSIIIYFIVYFSFQLIESFTSLQGELTLRKFEFKSFRFLMLALLVIIFVIARNKLGFWLLAVVNITYAFLDASRFSLVFVVILIMLYQSINTKFTGLCVILITLLTFCYSRFGVHFDLQVIIMYFWFVVSYVTDFNIYQLAYTIESTKGTFEVKDFLYSIIPIPSNLHFIEVNDRLWRIDAFRPLSGQGSVARLSLILLCFYNFFLGWLFGRCLRMTPERYVELFVLCIMIIFAMSFQYSIRTITWYVLFIYLLCFALSFRFIPKSRVIW